MNRLATAVVLVGICLLGIARLRWRRQQLGARVARLNEFRNYFGAYIGSKGQNLQAYADLTTKVERMQRDAGSAAVASLYRPPFENVVYRDFELLVNILPALNRTISSFRWGVDEGSLQHYVSIVDDALNRYAGRLQEWGEQFDRDAGNPLVWFREGIRALLLSPAFLLRSFGLWPDTRTASLVHSAVFRVISAVISVIVLAAAVVQIVTGWDATIEKLRGWGLPRTPAVTVPEQQWF